MGLCGSRRALPGLSRRSAIRKQGMRRGTWKAKLDITARNLLVPVPRFDSLAEYNRELLKRCDERREERTLPEERND